MKLKAFILTLAALLLCMPVYARKKDKESGKGSAKFTEQVYDFGNIHEKKGAVSHDFEFTNIGNGNLVIKDVRAECGCTRPEFPKSPIAPAKKNKIKVTYLPAGRPGSFEKTVTVNTNGNPGKIRLKIKGTVIPD